MKLQNKGRGFTFIDGAVVLAVIALLMVAFLVEINKNYQKKHSVTETAIEHMWAKAPAGGCYVGFDDSVYAPPSELAEFLNKHSELELVVMYFHDADFQQFVIKRKNCGE